MSEKLKITELELKILGRLWRMGDRGTVQEIIDSWSDPKPGYTTVLKKLQILESKNLVRHEKRGKAYIYIPIVSRQDASRNRISGLIERIFAGNKLAFANAFLEDADLSAGELQEIRNMINRKEEEESDDNS